QRGAERAAPPPVALVLRPGLRAAGVVRRVGRDARGGTAGRARGAAPPAAPPAGGARAPLLRRAVGGGDRPGDGREPRDRQVDHPPGARRARPPAAGAGQVTEVNVRDIIERLRDATSAAGETITEVPPLRLPDPRPRPWLTPLAAAAAVVLAIAGGVAVYRAGFGEHAAPAHGVAALPRFFAHVAGTDVVVRSSDSGREVGRLAAPSGREWYAHVAAAGDNRTFYAATEARDCRPRLYRFTVGEGGRVTAPQALPYGPPPGVMVTSLAVSGDGSTLAYGLQSCDPAAAAGRITVADTATGRTREWRGDRLVTGLSLSEDGRDLAFREAGLLVVVKDGTPRTVVPAPADDPPPQVDADPDPAETDVTSRPDPAAEDPALPVDADPAPAEAEPSPQATPGKPTPSASPERSSEKSPGKSSETSPKPSARATASPAPSGAPSPVRPGETETVPEPTPTA